MILLPPCSKTLFLVLASTSIAASIQCVSAQQPPERKGVTSRVLAIIDLGTEFPGMEGRALRLRINTIAPGGSTGFHGHKEKPSIVYVVHGDVIEYRDGKTKELAQGEVISQGKDHSHALENRGTSAAVLLESEVVNKE